MSKHKLTKREVRALFDIMETHVLRISRTKIPGTSRRLTFELDLLKKMSSYFEKEEEENE